MTKKVIILFLILLTLITGIYPFFMYFLEINFGIISTKDASLLTNYFWKFSFHTHIIFGAIALMVGWIQFSKIIQIKKKDVHKTIGKVYIISSLISAIASIFISFHATGGIIPFLGFILLGIIWFYSTFMGYFHIKSEEIELHQKMMIYSYACCFSGVTLRIWLPILLVFIDKFNTAYSIVAWLCWIPNLTVAYIITTNISQKD